MDTFLDFSFHISYCIPKTAIGMLLNFLALLENIKPELFNKFPSSLYKAERTSDTGATIQKYAVRPVCHTLHDQKTISTIKPTTCSHPQCNGKLTRPIKKKGHIIYRPCLVYPYEPITDQLALILQNSDIEKGFEHPYKCQSSPEGMLCDVYDGWHWHEMKDTQGNPFFVGGHQTCI